MSQSGELYNVVHSIHCIYYVTLYNIVQLLYNYAYCDLPYVHINRFRCTMSLVLQICTCTGSGVMFRPVARSVPAHRCL